MRIFLLSILSLLVVSCNSQLTEEIALERLRTLSEFAAPFHAPFNIGNEILNGENHENPDKYIKEHLGALLQNGLVDAKIVDKNSWRSVLNLQITEKGNALSDMNRTNEKSAYVQVCKVLPMEITEMRVIEENKIIEVDFLFSECEITPFGDHLGFENGRTHKDTRVFIRDGRKWNICCKH